MAAQNVLTTSSTGSRQLTTIDGQTLDVTMEPAGSDIIPPPYVFVFRPGATGTLPDNVFADPVALSAAMNLVQGPKLLEVDDGIVTPAVFTALPAGASYDWRDVEVKGTAFSSGSANGTVAQFAAGAKVNILNGQLRLRSITFQMAPGSTSPVFTIAGGIAQVQTDDIGFVEFDSVAGHPMFSVGVGGEFSMEVNDGNVTDGTNPSIILTDTTSLFALFVGEAASAINPIASPVPAGATVEVFADATSAALVTGLPVGVSVTLEDLASGVAYTPAVAGNWQPAPTEVAAALDQLAAPNTLTEKNAAGIGPLATVPFDTTGTISKKRSGKVVVTATMSGSGSTPTDGVTLFLRMDGVNQGAPANAFTEVGAAPNAAWSASLSWVFTLPDTAPHTFGIVAADTAAGTLTVPVSGAGVTAVEL
jgi:hypothetical protein